MTKSIRPGGGGAGAVPPGGGPLGTKPGMDAAPRGGAPDAGVVGAWVQGTSRRTVRLHRSRHSSASQLRMASCR
eukprot:2943466-Prorocentrum_lima.AAC.1